MHPQHSLVVLLSPMSFFLSLTMFFLWPLSFCLLVFAHLPFSSTLPFCCLFLVMLAPCRCCSLPSLMCLRTAAMKSLRRRRILHGFSLGPGTPLHGVCVCVCLLSYEPTVCPSGLRRLSTNSAWSQQLKKTGEKFCRFMMFLSSEIHQWSLISLTLVSNIVIGL